MEEGRRKKLIFIMGLLTVVFFITTVGSSYNLYKQKADRNREMAVRMDLEEKMDKITGELNRLKVQLEEEKSAHQMAKQTLSDEQEISGNLKIELERMQKLKEALEENLKDALVGPSKR